MCLSYHYSNSQYGLVSFVVYPCLWIVYTNIITLIYSALVSIVVFEIQCIIQSINLFIFSWMHKQILSHKRSRSLSVFKKPPLLTLVGWMSGKGSRDSGMNTTRISFLAFHSFLNRSILAAASSLMGDPGLWIGPATTQQKRVREPEAGRRGKRPKARWK